MEVRDHSMNTEKTGHKEENGARKDNQNIRKGDITQRWKIPR